MPDELLLRAIAADGIDQLAYPDGVDPAQVLDDLTTEILPPHEADGPQEPVDDSELEEEQHPTVPDEDD